ncbi:MAG TPA: hypothetical protein VFX28_18490, partial [Methylomirabilota bacterium]|nr:hypothetical protein [Methylomirabilota bacterium]
VAPPWSAVPWTVTALMEEAVRGGVAAFSPAEARRRGVPPLDLVSGSALRGRLAALAERLQRQAHVPPALRGLVTPAEARARWAALRAFQRRHGHFLLANGPYRLHRTAPAVTLAVFRDLSYPLVVGAWDRLAIPRRAFVTQVERRGDRLAVGAEVETVTRFERSYKIVREPFRPAPAGERVTQTLAARWVAVSADGQVLAAGAAQTVEGDRLVVDLGPRLPAGEHRVLVALALDGNLIDPEVKVIAYRGAP